MARLTHKTEPFAINSGYTSIEELSLEPADDQQWYSPLTKSVSNTLSTDGTYSDQFDERLDDFPRWSQADKSFHRGDTRIVLSLDGGGIRGLSTLLILQCLMRKIADIETTQWPIATTSADSPQIEKRRVEEEFERLRRKLDQGRGKSGGADHLETSSTSKFLPCHYFDYIAGTSTGNLIAAMLGRLCMSVDRTLEEFNDLTKRVYGLRYRSKVRKAKLILHLGTPPDEKVRNLMQQHFGNESLRFDRDRCKTICCSFEQSSGTTSSISPFLFRSYAQGQPDSRTTSYSVSDVLRATGCSPYYLSRVKLDTHEFFDAGFRWTNPTGRVFEELQLDGISPPTWMLSLGCGYVKTDSYKSAKSTSNQSRMTQTTVRLNQALWTLSENVHGFMEQQKHEQAIKYYRLNVPLDLSMVETEHGDSWKQQVDALRAEIQAVTKAYLARIDIDKTLNACATSLVELRRERSLTPGWEAFAFGIRYRCKHPDHCQLKDQNLSRDQLEAHLRDDHIPPKDPAASGQIKRLVETGRIRTDEWKVRESRS